MANKRKRQEDFQKVKLRVGKKRARAENVTDTGCRVRAVHVSRQLREDSALPSTKRKLTLADILSQMNHYNAGVKHDALVGLKEILLTHPSVIHTHISAIMSEVAAVFTDKDPMVRSAAISVLQHLVPLVCEEKIAPFFPLVSAHLSTAMTHIMIGIQEDSLKILDILLEAYPDLLIDRSSMLLNNFLELISHQKSSKEIKCAEKPSMWTLSVNPNRKITSQKWRINVLSRLKKFLQALVRQAAKRFPSKEGLQNSAEKLFCSNNNVDVSWAQHAKGKQPINLYDSGEARSTMSSAFCLRMLADVSTNAEECFFSSYNLKQFIHAVVPILIECWVEEAPEKTMGDGGENFLEPIAHHLLQQVLSIISLLWKLSELQDEPQKLDGWLRKSYLKDFKHHFMKHFPYTMHDPLQPKRKVKRSDKDGFFPHNGLDQLLLNLTLCDIMVFLATSSTLHEDLEWLTMIRIFVTEKLVSGWKLNSKQLKRLLEVTNRLLYIQKNRVATEKLIEAVYMMYQQRDLQFSVRSMLLTFFNKVYLKEDDVCLNQGRSRSKLLSRWLASLPLQLLHLGARNHQLSALIIDTIYIAAARSNKELLQNLQTAACQIYDSEDGFFVHLPEDLQLKLVQLLYFIPFLSSDLLVCLSQFCITERFSPSLISKLLGIFHARSSFGNWMYSAPETTIIDVDYFSFLFSAMMGFSTEQLSWMQSNKISSRVSSTRVSPITLYLTDQPYFTHHWTVMQMVCNTFSSMRPRHQCFDILQNAVIKHLSGMVVVPDSTIGSVLHTVNNLLDQSCNPTESFHVFLASSCYSIFNFLLTIENDVEHVQKSDYLWGECISLLSLLPNVLKLMLQNLQVSRACQEELPVIAQLLRLLLQNTQLRSHMMTNAFLVQQTLQDVMNMKSCEIQEQWLIDLQYCFNVYLTKQIQE
ncbi:Testis-expressed sequence 10 protein [Pristimantis euphronides]